MTNIDKIISRWEPDIALEVHFQLSTRSKMFCSCANQYGSTPNTLICPVCLGLPESVPALNKATVKYAVRLGLALDCQISQVLSFNRKNYNLPDLPKGYQITQHDHPICSGGFVKIHSNGQNQLINLDHIRLEERSGQMLQDSWETMIDFNCSGVPIVTIVTLPEIHSPVEARIFLERLKQTAKYLGISDCNVEKGHFSCDVKIGMRQRKNRINGRETEIRDLRSFRHVELAIRHEIKRQAAILEGGARVIESILHWNESTGQTELLAVKDKLPEFRFFPETGMIIQTIDPSWITKIQGALPELPFEKENRLVYKYGINLTQADILAAEPELADCFEELSVYVKPKYAVKWILGEVLRAMHKLNVEISEFPVKPIRLGELVNHLEKKTITKISARKVFHQMLKDPRNSTEIILDQMLFIEEDYDKLLSVIQSVFDANPEETLRYKEGDTNLKGLFIGQVMQATEGKADPGTVELLLAKLTKN